MEPRNTPRTARRDRGAQSNPVGRHDAFDREAVDDGWGSLAEPLPRLATTVGVDHPRRLIARNRSPDVPFDRSINPYRGCEHGCIYCFARPDHARLGLSPGQDFESRLFAKAGAAERLEAELRHPGYQPAAIALGANTDPYQPIEREWRITRGILQVLADYRHPVTIVTKGSLVERDIDLLAELAAHDAVRVDVSLTTLCPRLKRQLEPRAPGPGRRLRVIERLSAAGIPCGVLVAPVIPALTDHELEELVGAAAAAGAVSAGYVLLRLPGEVEGLFREWLSHYCPERAGRVLARLRDCHGGACYAAAFGRRMEGRGAWAEMLRKRFSLACRRAGLDSTGRGQPTAAHFRRPPRPGDQAELFE